MIWLLIDAPISGAHPLLTKFQFLTQKSRRKLSKLESRTLILMSNTAWQNINSNLSSYHQIKCATQEEIYHLQYVKCKNESFTEENLEVGIEHHIKPLQAGQLHRFELDLRAVRSSWCAELTPPSPPPAKVWRIFTFKTSEKLQAEAVQQKPRFPNLCTQNSIFFASILNKVVSIWCISLFKDRPPPPPLFILLHHSCRNTCIAAPPPAPASSRLTPPSPPPPLRRRTLNAQECPKIYLNRGIKLRAKPLEFYFVLMFEPLTWIVLLKVWIIKYWWGLLVVMQRWGKKTDQTVGWRSAWWRDERMIKKHDTEKRSEYSHRRKLHSWPPPPPLPPPVLLLINKLINETKWGRFFYCAQFLGRYWQLIELGY